MGLKSKQTKPMKPSTRRASARNKPKWPELQRTKSKVLTDLTRSSLEQNNTGAEDEVTPMSPISESSMSLTLCPQRLDRHQQGNLESCTTGYESSNDTSMPSPESESSAGAFEDLQDQQNRSTSRPQEQSKGTIIASEGGEYMLDLGTCVTVRSAAEIEGKGFQTKLDEANSMFNSPSDWALMQDLKQQKDFDNKIENVRCSEVYGRKRRTCLFYYKGQSRALRCSRSNMVKLITEKRMNEFLEKGKKHTVNQPSLESQGKLINGPSPAPKRKAPIRRMSEVPISNSSVALEDARGEKLHYLIIAKDHKRNPAQRVTDSTHCILQNQKGKYEAKTWLQIKICESLGTASFDDRDYGHGLHPEVDQKFLKEFEGANKLNSETGFELLGAIMYHSKNKTRFWITAIFKLKDEVKSKELFKKRRIADYGYEHNDLIPTSMDYEYDYPIRCSRTFFENIGGTYYDLEQILERNQPEMLSEYKKRKKAKSEEKKEAKERELRGTRRNANVMHTSASDAGQLAIVARFLPQVADWLPEVAEGLSREAYNLKTVQA